MKVLIVYYHCKSLGHSQRVLNIAKAFEKSNVDWEITILSGGLYPNYFKEFDNYNLIQLPELKPKDGMFAGLCSASNLDLDQVLIKRQEMIEKLICENQYDAVVTEFFPFARKKLWEEFEKIMAIVKEKNIKAKIFSSVRDIVETIDPEDKERADDVNNIISKYYDQIWVHSDPTFQKINYSIYDQNIDKIKYTGYLTKEVKKADVPTSDEILIASGGGKDSYDVMKALIPYMEKSKKKFKVLIGPYFQDEFLKEVKSLDSVQTVEFDENVSEIYQEASLIISMCGYNSFSEIIMTAKPFLFLPREVETEQLRRTKSLQEIDENCCFEFVDLEDFDNYLERRVKTFKPVNIQLNGIQNLTSVINEAYCV